jgi:hypothetical protein
VGVREVGLAQSSVVALPVPNAQGRRDERLRKLNECYHKLTATCAVCYALGRQMVDDHTVEDCTKDVGTLDDENFRNFRSSPTFPKESRMCYGCWVPGNVRACLRLLISIEVRSPRFILQTVSVYGQGWFTRGKWATSALIGGRFLLSSTSSSMTKT